jgi:hypothetical protein
MPNRIATGLAALTAGVALALAGGEPLAAQDKKPAPGAKPGTDLRAAPKFLYGHDLRVRPAGKANFGPDTPRVGVELFHDEATGALIGISEAGAITVLPAGPVGKDQTCKWLTAHDLAARKAGEADFTQKTKKYGVELFRDMGSNRLLYMSEAASPAFAPIPGGLVTDRGPKWHHGLEPRVRGPEQPGFDSAKRIGVEAFRDENTNGLVYVTETGAIATAEYKGAAPDPKKIAPPKTEYGLVLQVRGANEADFTDATKRIGVEVFSDPNAGNQLIYITEAGYVATAPNPGKFNEIPKGTTAIPWRAAMILRARKGGEKSFDAARRYGIEVFQDARTGNLIFISETGSIAVLPKS